MAVKLKEALEVAIMAAQAGAAELMEGYGQSLEIRYKGPIDLVTDFDLRSEAAVKKVIFGAFPDHLILAEESGLTGSSHSDHQWFVDPLDGTTNFTRSHPFFSVSVCYAGPDEDGFWRPLVGVTLAPVLGEMFWASKGQGGFYSKNIPGRESREARLKVTKVDDPVKALVNTGFPYDIFQRPEEVLGPFGRMVRSVRAVRRAGAATLDLAYVAAGRAEAFWETGLKPWDVAVGLLLVEEAGGRISDYQGGPFILDGSRDILATNGILHENFLGLLGGGR